MIPLKDYNPTRRTAFVTVLLIAASIGVFWWVQPTGRVGLLEQPDRCAEAAFTIQHAAVPEEVVEGEPLTVQEVRELVQGQCEVVGPPDQAVFPNKNVYFALVVSMFLHGSWMHLLGNMLFLWVFGNNIEDRLHKVGYLAFYLAGGLAATAAHVAIQPSSTIPVVGASGAISAVMGAYLVLFPRVRIKSLVFLGFFAFLPDIPAWFLLGYYFVSQFFIGPDQGIAWAAHVGGFVFGVAGGIVIRALTHQARPRASFDAFGRPYRY